jgi:hypothetical protein
MWEILNAKIKETLGTVKKVKQVSSIPETKWIKWPAVFFKPLGFTNDFETQNENNQTYRFMMIVMVGTNQTTMENAFDVVLPRTVDAIISAFDEAWDAGVIDGHRVRVKIDSADAWEVSEEEDGLTAYAPLNVEIRLLTSN